jgi:hypothetical protein
VDDDGDKAKDYGANAPIIPYRVQRLDFNSTIRFEESVAYETFF